MILSLYNSNIFVRRKTVLLDETVQLLDRLGPAADAASKRDFKKAGGGGGGGELRGCAKLRPRGPRTGNCTTTWFRYKNAVS